MTPTLRRRLALAFCLALAAGCFVTGIDWGLPSRAADPYLFGSREPWTGAEILKRSGGWGADATKGADVDLNPLTDRSKPVWLNETDAQRAEIVRRYRLFSYQPDEWNTMRSLAGMRPGEGQLDPRLYQYGGLWVYPVGAMLKAASMAGLIRLTPDLAFYLDHPEAFGRFYIVARLYSAAWGVVGAWAVWRLAWRLTASTFACAAATLCYVFMPVVVNAAHEAKPHLAGMVLMLLAVLAACRFVETGRRRWWVAAGALCGAALGMVISSAVVFVILPLMVLFRDLSWRRRADVAAGAVAVGFAVYFLTNPYVLYNAVFNRDVLRSNLGTSTAMYQVTAGEGLTNALRLITEGTSMPVAVGFSGAVAWLVASGLSALRKQPTAPAGDDADGAAGRRAHRPPGYVVALLGVPALLVGCQFVALAAGKPGEYGRFALLPDVVLALATVTVLAWPLGNRVARVVQRAVLAFVVLFCAVGGWNYLRHFIADAAPTTSRLAEAERLAALARGGARRLGVLAEPAPYVMPPADLWAWRIQLLPRGQSPGDPETAGRYDVIVRAVDEVAGAPPARWERLDRDRRAAMPPARISWASKPFEVLVPALRPPVPATQPPGAGEGRP